MNKIKAIEDPQLLYESVGCRLQFIGKILSLFTHQLNNHLAIIKDSLGFLQDLAEFKGINKQDAEEILNTIGSLEQEIGKAVVLSKKLNSFGHRMDNLYSTYNINDAIEEVLVLISRATIEKRLQFSKCFDLNIEPVHGNPALIQFLIFCLIDRFIRMLPPKGNLTVRTADCNDTIKIELTSQNELENRGSFFCPDNVIELAASLHQCDVSWDRDLKKVDILIKR